MGCSVYPPTYPNTPRQSEDFRGNSRSSMLSKTLPLLALFCGALALNEHKDVECFNSKFPDYNKTINHDSTFDIRIEHAGSILNIGDWFDNGEVYTIKQGEVYPYNTTAQAMSEICAAVDAFDGDWCEGAMSDIGNQQRFLVVGFDGEDLLAAMYKMEVNVTTTEATWEWKVCESKTNTAVQDMNELEFTYVHWDTSKVTGDLPDWWSPEDKLYLSGASSAIASIVTLLVSLFISTSRLF